MNCKHCWSAAGSGLAGLLILASAQAWADVRTGSPDPELLAAIRQGTGNDVLIPAKVMYITGEIGKEDAGLVEDTLEAMRSEIAYQEELKLLAVLDSPGGNFEAGIAIARAFNKVGVPTLVPPGATCLSACAVAFMAGTRVSMGGEGGISRSRTVIMPADLGFHRPFLADVAQTTLTPGVLSQLPPDEVAQFFEDQYVSAFDAANELLQNMLEVDPDAWSADLLWRMLTAKQGGADGGFVRLETVQDALSWDIQVANVRTPAVASAKDRFEAAFALCFNYGPSAESSIRRFWPAADALDREYQFNANTAARQTGDKVGIFIHHEAPMGCEVTFSGARARVSVGQFEASDPVRAFDLNNGNERLWGHHPYAKLKRIAMASAATRSHRCMVLSDSTVLDDEPCRLETRVTGEREIVDTFHWPSGSRTVVQTLGVRRRLNGSGVSQVSRLPPGMDLCLRSDATLRTFCYGEQ